VSDFSKFMFSKNGITNITYKTCHIFEVFLIENYKYYELAVC